VRRGLAVVFGGLGLVVALAGCAGQAPQPEPAPSAAPPRAAAQPSRPADRAVRIVYRAELRDVPPGEPVQVWIPLPEDDEQQRIGELLVEPEWPGELREQRVTHDPVWGNRILYLEGTVDGGAAAISITYDVERWVRRPDLRAFSVDGDPDPSPLFARDLTPPRLVVIDDQIQELADSLPASGAPTLSVARAFYDHVAAEMTYDKSGEGWGLGDSLYACSVGEGNCTDYHAYFMALCLARGIPARFQIGLFGPYEPRPGVSIELGGYHCWAEFRVPGRGWVPVDVSEGDKEAMRYELCFGGHTANRVTLSSGRDLVLEPAQAGEPLNYFVNPYAEVGGLPHAGVSKTATWLEE
jgi:transglutaminase-like putative cysteine protease